MQERLTTVTRKGQITLPAEVRRALGIQVGDKMAVSLAASEEGSVLVRPIRSVAEATFGAVTPNRRPEDLAALRRQFEEETGQRAHRKEE